MEDSKNKLTGIGSVDVEVVFRSMVNARIKIEHTYFKLINDIQMFSEIWSVGGVLYEVLENGMLVLKF